MRYFLFILLTLSVAGCTSTRVVPVETVRVDSVYLAKVERDSIFVRDSVLVVVRGDTVFKTDLKYVYRDRVVRDTVFRLKCDTVTTVVEVEKALSFWQQRKLEFGGVAMILLPLMALVIVLKR